MKAFTIEAVHTLEAAIRAGAAGGRYIAGGTTLIDLMREEVEQPDHLVDVNGLPLAGIATDGDTLVIGALVRMADLAAHPDARRLQPLIVESLVEGASPQLRNLATIGGNLLQRVRCPYFRMRDAACNKRTKGEGCAALGGINNGHAILGTSEHCIATHPSDLAVALVALDAVMHVVGPEGERIFPVEELFRLPGDTPHLEHTLKPAEIIVDVRVPCGPYSGRARYLKVRERSSYEFALVSGAVALDLEADVIREARVAVGGVGTRPWRLRRVEAALRGQVASRTAFEAAAKLAAEGAIAREHNGYKLELLPRTIVQALELAGAAGR
jgi:xanthine dehydrogenase YagS FAD-binding subunit